MLFVLDWMVVISSSPHPHLSSRLYYGIPALLQSHGYSHNTSLPSTYGWMFLSSTREWQYDPMIKVTPHYVRNMTSASPCLPEQYTAYTGHQLAGTSTPHLQACVAVCQGCKVCKGVTWHNYHCVLRAEMLDKVVIMVNKRMNNHQSVRMACPPATWTFLWLLLLMVFLMAVLVGWVMAWKSIYSRRRITTGQREMQIAIIRID